MDRLMIEVDGVSKSFATTIALDDVHLHAEGGKVLAVALYLYRRSVQ
jgi:ABC-type sugar transport system ATPase subunit